ncbi:hypothetical protein [Streptomyces sp. NPDC050287]|uniref:hypothetical protein n=1 Tax=Streptomyces sp. NPDC050287 TaxID=3365608 RepID=UPI0037A65104
MHRTTTTATLLVTVAVSALAGCVTVQRPPAPGPPTAPSRPSAPRPDGPAEPQVVQAPAREALEMTDPSRHPKPAAGPSAPAQPRQQLPPRTHPARRADPEGPEPRHPDAGQRRRPRVDTPDLTRTFPGNQQDVCALGKKYGGWRADSPEAMICDQAYGR